MTHVLVLNAGYEPLHRVSVKHAMTMLWRGVAVVEEAGPDYFGPFLRPTVLRLVKYVRMSWAYTKKTGKAKMTELSVKATWEDFSNPVPGYSLANLLKRDHGQCAYCGQPGADSADHVIPRSAGGPTHWSNLVAAHQYPCNAEKADRSLEEAGMTLLWEPFVPTWDDLRW